jgi:hypothetical protein
MRNDGVTVNKKWRGCEWKLLCAASRQVYSLRAEKLMKTDKSLSHII